MFTRRGETLEDVKRENPNPLIYCDDDTESYIKFQQDDYDYVKIIKCEELLEVVKLLMTLMFMCVPGMVQGYATRL